MMVIVFRNRVRAEAEERYAERGLEMERLAMAMPGFVSIKDFVAEDGERLSVIEFENAETLAAWRDQPDHRVAQHQGRAEFYEQYAIQVCELVREARFVAEPAPVNAGPAAGGVEIRPYDGGCACGAIRYRTSGTPSEPSLCHCSICRRSSGAPVVAWATFPTASLEWLSGSPRTFVSSSKASRTFCGDCGTPLAFRFNAKPESTDVTLGSLDEPRRIAPADHIYTSTQVPWLRLADGLPRFPDARPRDT